MRLKLSVLLLLLAPALLGSGCTMSGARLLQPFAKLFGAQEERPTRPQLQREIGKRIEEKEFSVALNLIESGLSMGMDENDFASQYPAALNGVLAQALELQRLDQPLEAGSLYRIASLHFPRTAALQERAWMTPTEIDASIELCASRLLETGLLAYRNGDFDKAIATWESIATFHPDHTASQRAIETTRTQLSTLKRLEQP